MRCSLVAQTLIIYVARRRPLLQGDRAVQVIGWVPTGWTYENKRNMFPVKTKGNCSIHLVPYSEHSSYNELQTYVKFLRPHEARWHPLLLANDLLRARPISAKPYEALE